jgi:hypothetical protein
LTHDPFWHWSLVAQAVPVVNRGVQTPALQKLLLVLPSLKQSLSVVQLPGQPELVLQA